MERDDQHLYLITLEIEPLDVAGMYNPLPAHLTLVSRFWSELPSSRLANILLPVFKRAPAIELVFAEPAKLGPKQVTAHLIAPNPALQYLHTQLVTLLTDNDAKFLYPQFIGEHHKPHVTQREHTSFVPGQRLISSAAYLIEVEIRSNDDHVRLVCEKFNLAG